MTKPIRAAVSVFNSEPEGGISGSLTFNVFSAVVNVSGASLLAGPVSPESIVVAKGSNLASATLIGPQGAPPLRLGGTTVNVRDSAGVDRLARPDYVSPEQDPSLSVLEINRNVLY